METSKIKKTYQKPEIQVIDINFESSLLVTSGKPPEPQNIPIG